MIEKFKINMINTFQWFKENKKLLIIAIVSIAVLYKVSPDNFIFIIYKT